MCVEILFQTFTSRHLKPYLCFPLNLLVVTFSGTPESVEIKICRTRVLSDPSPSPYLPASPGGVTVNSSSSSSAGPQPWWGPGDSLLIPCQGGTVLEVRHSLQRMPSQGGGGGDGKADNEGNIHLDV